jgi:hypothetical protein
MQNKMHRRRINVYKWWFFAGFCMFVFCVQPVKAQPAKQDLIEAFLKDIINVNITGETLMKKYMCTLNAATQPALDLELYRLRMKLLGQSKKVTNHFGDYLKLYNELSENERDIIISKADEDNVFSFKGEQGIAFLVLIKGDKIASFTTVKKGNARVFINYCN